MYKPIKKGLGTVLHHKTGKPYPTVSQWTTAHELVQFENEVNACIDEIRADIVRHMQEKKP